LNTQENYGLFSSKNLKIRPGPAGVHIFDRNTGLNILLDEIVLPQQLWPEAPQQVSIALTNLCNLSCSYCYSPKDSSSIDFERVKDWLAELDVNGCACVGFGGGEPTLYPHLVELCDYAVNKTGLAVTITTNAHSWDKNLIQALKGKIHFIRVSMDGIGPTYEALRGKSFIEFCHRIELVHNISSFGINFVVNSSTFPDLENAIVLASEMGATNFLLLPQQPTKKEDGIDIRTFRELQDWVGQYQGPIQLLISEAGSEGMPFCNPLAAEDGLLAYAHIDAHGFIKRSSFDVNGMKIDSQGVIYAIKQLCKRPKEEYL
jgi:MoaA/NifB/PqqE/SkfB family radical SAM enzyme